MEINANLKKYIEENIFPVYEKNEKAHGIEHIKYVIERSFKFAKKIPNADLNIVYTVAAFHDIGHHIDSKNHEVFVRGKALKKKSIQLPLLLKII